MPTTIRFRRDGVVMHMHPVAGSAHPEGRWHQPWERHPSDPHAHELQDAEHPYVLTGRYPVEWSRREYYLTDAQEATYFRALHGGRPSSYFRPGRTPERAALERSATIDESLLAVSTSPRRFGVEIECIMNQEEFVASVRAKGINIAYRGYTHEDSTMQWKLVTDGSLRYTGSRPGFRTIELVSPILQGDAGFAQLQMVCESLRDTRAIVNRTCGLHVHHDASRDLSAEDARRVALIYHNASGAINKMVSPSRRGGGFCKGFNHEDLQVINAATTIDQMRIRDRYKAVNFQAYQRHKTIEFRQHQASVEFQKIAAWVKFGQHIFQAARAGVTVPSGTNDPATLFDLIGLPEDLKTYFVNRVALLAVTPEGN